MLFNTELVKVTVMLCICICKSPTDASLVKLSRNSKKWTVSVRHTCEGLSAHIFSRLTDCIYPVKVRSATAQKHSMIAFILIFAHPQHTHRWMWSICTWYSRQEVSVCVCVSRLNADRTSSYLSLHELYLTSLSKPIRSNLTSQESR